MGGAPCSSQTKEQTSKDRSTLAMGLGKAKECMPSKPPPSKKPPGLNADCSLSDCTKGKIECAVRSVVDNLKNKKCKPCDALNPTDVGEKAGDEAAKIATAVGASSSIIEKERRKADRSAQEEVKLEKIKQASGPAKEKAESTAAQVQMELMKAQSQAAKAEAKESMANAQLESLAVEEAAGVMDARMMKSREETRAKIKAGEECADPETAAFNKELELLVSKGFAKECNHGKGPNEAAKAGAKALTAAAVVAKMNPEEAGQIAADAARDVDYPPDAIEDAAASAAESVANAEGAGVKEVSEAIAAARASAKLTLESPAEPPCPVDEPVELPPCPCGAPCK